MYMTTFDLLLVGVIVSAGLWGIMAGASRIGLYAAVIVACATAVLMYPRVSIAFERSDSARLFLTLALLFAALIIFGLLFRAIANATSAIGFPFDKVLGLALGLFTGALLAGLTVWTIETFGDAKWRTLLKDSEIAPSALAFFNFIAAFGDRLFRAPEPSPPWWLKKPW